MKKQTILTAVIVLLIVTTVACGPATSPPTPDTQATVDAAVAATSTAQANMQATIDAAVQATGAAAPPTGTAAPTSDVQATVDAAVQATMAAAPTPVPTTEYVTMTEEELAAAVDQAATEAAASSQEYSTATTQATADDVVTYEELALLLIYLADAEQAIAYAEQLIYAYYDLYGDLAMETLALLQIIEQDLALLLETTATLSVLLQEVDAALQQGLVVAAGTLTQLETAAQNAGVVAGDILTQSQKWAQDLLVELEARAANVLSVQPNEIAANRVAALHLAFDYIDSVRQALADGKLSQSELAAIAQLGANAGASLAAQGGAPLQQYIGSFNDITALLAKGQLPQAQAGLATLESALGSRPPLPRP